jgi:hypothetical protein
VEGAEVAEDPRCDQGEAFGQHVNACARRVDLDASLTDVGLQSFDEALAEVRAALVVGR